MEESVESHEDDKDASGEDEGVVEEEECDPV